MKIKPSIGVGSEGVTFGVKISDIGGGNKHRNARQPDSRVARRQARFDRQYLDPPPVGEPSTIERHQHEYDIEKQRGYYEYPDPYGYEQSDREDPPRPERSVRGPVIAPKPGEIRVSRGTVWQVVFQVLRELWIEVDERRKHTRHRWDYDDPVVIIRRKNERVVRPEHGVWLPPEWEPPPRVIDKVTKQVAAELGRIVIGPLVVAEPDVLVWLPEAPKGAPARNQPKVRVERRGREKQRVIVMEPTPSAKPVEVSPPQSPVFQPETPPVTVPASIPAPATQPVPNPPAWGWGMWTNILIGAVALLPPILDMLPDTELSIVHGGGVPPRLEVAVRPGMRAGRWYDEREHRLRKDSKTMSDQTYLAVVRFIQRSWNTISNVAEVGQALLQSTHRDPNNKKDFGYKRWDRWIHDIRTGRAEVDFDEFLLRLMLNEVEDRLIARMSALTTVELRKAGVGPAAGGLRHMGARIGASLRL